MVVPFVYRLPSLLTFGPPSHLRFIVLQAEVPISFGNNPLLKVRILCCLSLLVSLYK